VLGISILSGAHTTLVPKITTGLKEYGTADETLVLVGGVIPDGDRAQLREKDVDAIFGPGTAIEETIEFVRENAPSR